MKEKTKPSGFRSGFLLGSGTNTKPKRSEKSIKRNKKRSSKTSSSTSGGGYAKGFLLSKPKRDISNTNNINDDQSKKLTSVSQELKNVGGSFKRNPLIIGFEEEQQQKQQSQQQDMGGGGTRNPLITVLDEESNNPTSLKLEKEPIEEKNQTQFVFDKEEEPLFQEVATTRKRYDDSLQSQEVVNTKILSIDQNNQNKDEPSWLDFQQELESILWKASKHKSDSVIPTIKEWSTQQVTWAWECLLTETKSTTTKSKQQYQQPLFLSLLKHHSESILSYLHPQGQEARTITLKLLRLLKAFLKDPNSQQQQQQVDWPINILQSLQSLSKQQHRTVLAQESWNTAILLLTVLCSSIVEESKKENGNLESFEIPSMMKTFDQLIQTQILWKQSKKKSVKRQCEIAILNDWKKLSDTLYKQKDGLIWCCEVCHKFGGLQQTLYITTSSSFPDEDFTALDQALYSYFQEKSSHGVIFTKELEKRSILRRILLLGEKLTSTERQQMIDTLLKVLPTCDSQDTIDLVMSLLGLAEFTSSNSFESLLKAMDSLSTEQSTLTTINAACQALGSLISLCIVEDDNSLKLLQSLVKQNGVRKTTYYVISMVLTNNSFANKDERALFFAAETLIVNIPSSEYLRHLLDKDNASLVNKNIPLNFIIPRLFQVVIEVRNGASTNKKYEVRSCVGNILTSMLGIYIQKSQTLEFISQIVLALEKAVSKVPSSETTDFVGDICSVFGGRCRRLVLEGEEFSDDSFQDLLSAIAKAMLSSPESLSPLGLFGAIVGEDVSDEFGSNKTLNNRILLAIQNLVTLCCSHMKKKHLDGSNVIFSRLSPLLVLRRIPVVYFRIARQEIQSKRRSLIHNPFDLLAKELVIRLCSDRIHDAFIPQERRLAAEVAGRSLTFGCYIQDPNFHLESQLCSMYHQICDPVFERFLANISERGSQLVLIKQAKGVIYAVCNHLNFATDEVYYFENCYMKTASFALNVLRLDLEMINMDNVSDMVQLQTGCIEFFAACIEKMLQVNTLSATSKLINLVEHASNSGLHHTLSRTTRQNGYSLSTSLPLISQALISIIRNGTSEAIWVDSTEIHPTPTRICIWNVFILVSKRCQEADNSLFNFSKSVIPWIIDWGKSEPDDSIHHPLCLAAAIQVIYILVTRSRKLDGFGGGDDASTLNIRKAHRWALNLLKQGSRGHGEEKSSNGLRDMRLGALKLLLAIVTIDNMNSDEAALGNAFGPGELGETFTVISGLSNMDPDPGVRILASKICGSLITS